MWQDIFLGAASIPFTGALVPSIISKNKPALWTSLLTSILLLGTTAAYSTLGMPLAAGGCALTLIAWLILLWQKVYVNR